jgi:hypothetical protein
MNPHYKGRIDSRQDKMCEETDAYYATKGKVKNILKNIFYFKKLIWKKNF